MTTPLDPQPPTDPYQQYLDDFRRERDEDDLYERYYPNPHTKEHQK